MDATAHAEARQPEAGAPLTVRDLLPLLRKAVDFESCDLQQDLREEGEKLILAGASLVIRLKVLRAGSPY